MSDKFHNPFLVPPKVSSGSDTAPQVAQQTNAPTMTPPITPANAPVQPVDQPAAQPVQAAPHPAMAQPEPQPQQTMYASPASPAAPAMPTMSPVQVQQSAVRETAANPATPIKTPNPFDFANQGGQGGGNKAGGGAHNGGASDGGNNDGGERIRYQALTFTGGIAEYYGVVILNYLLTLITLGIYSPWAKVRKQRYFFSHTELLDEGFQYLATGKQLFLGRIVAIIALIGLSLAELVPFIGILITGAALLFGLPFVLNRSVRFNARNVAWRDVRFGWQGSFGMAFLVWLVYPLLSLLTLGLAQPLAARALRRHYAENHSFGGADFSADLGLGSFYVALLKAATFSIILAALLIVPTVALAYASLATIFQGVTSSDEVMLLLAFLSPEQQGLLVLPFIAIFLAFYIAGKYYFALVRHIMINHLRLKGGIRFQSKLSAFKYAFVILSNLLINIMTLGFAHPFTVVRHYRYLVQSIEIRPIRDMAGFVDAQTKAGFSVFEEVSDIEGLSIDI